MIPVIKALWVIERNLGTTLSLDDLARAAGVSRFHLVRAFSAAIGQPPLQYLRARRLSVAACSLVAGADDILTVALDAGYGSHEAFSRAIKAQFGITPERIRRGQTTKDFPMTEAAKFPETTGAPIGEPRIEAGAPMLMIGLARRYQLQDHEGIPGQWQSFMAMAHEIPHRVPAAPVSVCMNMDEEGRYDYVCAVEVTKVVRVPDGLSEVRVPAQTYAAFTHTGHVTGLPNTYAAIFSDWFPKQSRIPSGGPSLEKHLATFDPRTGMGGVEIWIPVD